MSMSSSPNSSPSKRSDDDTILGNETGCASSAGHSEVDMILTFGLMSGGYNVHK